MFRDKILQLNGEWSLFLDRDGVINKRPMNDYVKQWSQFHFIEGVLDSVNLFAKIFKYTFIVTNQQGIGKNLMTEEDLEAIHQKMLDEMAKKGGRVEAVFHCPDLATKPVNCRKPGLYMAERAKALYPDIDFQKSIMVGDTMSDMEFGKNAGMTTVFVGAELDIINNELVDYRFNSLKEFAFDLAAND